MLTVETFTFNPFQENTYLIANENKHCWIVDPGMYDNAETNHLLGYMEKNGLVPQAIINTHTHIDHILGVRTLMEKFDLPFSFHEKDLPVLQSAIGSALMFGLDFRNPPKATGFITEGQPLILGEEELEVRFVPGHSPGSICFYYAPGGWVIGGDVLFNGSIGRTDLPGGNHQQLLYSIQTEMFTLPDATKVYSGHGPDTTIGAEKAHNPFLQGLL
jgi:glyoxylase-like metal-dependent hydrolase (beta-lactamase superfamily II)